MARPRRTDGEAIVNRVAALCSEKRAEDVVVLDVRGLVDYMDFMVLATGRSDRQHRAIAEHLTATLKTQGHRPLSVAGLDSGTWICLDYVDFVVHLFDPAMRSHYDLELLWGDAKRVAV
jgi:ribosome-associated protein